jgi:hypothetical protein
MGTFNGALFGGPATPTAGSTTASQIVYTALRIAGVIAAPGRGYSNGEFSDGLDTLNALIESWNIEFGTIPAITRALWPLVAGQAQYQIGPGAADFNTARPSKLERAAMIILTGGNLIELPMRVIDFEQWSRIRLKATASNIPHKVYYDRASPIGTLNIYETPSDSTAQIALYTATTLAAIPDATTAFSLPPGYLRALEYNLAVDLAPRFPDRATLGDLAIATALQSKSIIMALNARSPRARLDGDLPGHGGGLYNWLTGQMDDE